VKNTPAPLERPLERGIQTQPSFQGGVNKVDGGINTISFETQIDQLVFELYELSET